MTMNFVFCSNFYTLFGMNCFKLKIKPAFEQIPRVAKRLG
jgi:hypothetical protein